LAKWAEEMQRCQSIMSEMASCQRIFEQKAIDAEEKLRKWRKKNPLKGDGKSGYDGSGKKKSSDDSDSYSDDEQSVKVRKYCDSSFKVKFLAKKIREKLFRPMFDGKYNLRTRIRKIKK